MSAAATLVVEFGDSADSSAFYAAEFDETLNLDNSGEATTDFAPGDELYFWVQHDSSLAIASVESTDRRGTLVDCGTVTRSRDQEVTFTSTDSVDLSYIPASAPTITWYGEVGTRLTVSGKTVAVSGNTPCTADLVFPVAVHLFRYVPPPLVLASDEDTHRIVFVITLEGA